MRLMIGCGEGVGIKVYIPSDNIVDICQWNNKEMLSKYKAALTKVSFGKSLPDALYIHQDLIPKLPPVLSEIVVKVKPSSNDFNVIKFSKRQLKLSFLTYRNFFDDAHPKLQKSYSIDLASAKTKTIDYSSYANPPILHRKELLISKSSPFWNKFNELTMKEEEAGLFANPRGIGFLLNWKQLLSDHGLVIKGHKLYKVNKGCHSITSSNKIDIERHKTAITRTDLSKPIKLALESNLIDKGKTVFDYGCGLGTDILGLQALGYSANGWDPVYRPEQDRICSDVVNLGYVLNVIENPAERIETLLAAWDLTRELLVVSCMVNSQAQYDNVQPYRDGVLTKRNTFQKYYRQRELQSLLEESLGVDAVALSVGVFVCFRHLRQQQEFLASRERRFIDWTKIREQLPFKRKERILVLEKLYQENTELIEEYFKEYIQRGRPPIANEFRQFNELQDRKLTRNRLERIFTEKYDVTILNDARNERTNDLLVYFAMASFSHKLSFSELPDSIVADIKAFYGSYKNLQRAAKEILFSVGDPETIISACEDLSFGFRYNDQITFHVSLYDKLPPSLKIYIKCGLKLAGNLSEYDLVKIHARSGKVSFMKYADFDIAPLPELLLRVKVDMRRADAEVFDYQEWGESQLLVDKERYFGSDTQRSDTSLQAMSLLEQTGNKDLTTYGPTKEQFLKLLEYKNISPQKFFP